ncbi:MAG: hypothetical protein JO110_04560 [Acetobacteraceae bacterium]|nr:hypothetical protein [Acetobacteraceae bacterium]
MKALTKLTAAAALLAMTGSAMAASQNFELVNHNDTTSVVGLYVAHAGSKEPWSANILSHPIGPSETRGIEFTGYPANDCFWDVKVVFGDGGTVVRNDVNLCRESRIVAT